MALRRCVALRSNAQRDPDLSVFRVAALRVTLVTQRATQHITPRNAIFHV